MPGKKGRKIRRNFRHGGTAGSTTNYRLRRQAGVPKGGDGGKWRNK